MKIRTIIGYVGLKLCWFLPGNESKIKLGQKQIRAFFAKLFMDKAGKKINISKHAKFSHRCQIGDYSGIGENSRLYGKIIIGKDVMMGKDCWIYTQNHEYNDLKIPMRLQGPQTERPVTIGDNVWIGGRVTILPGVEIKNGAVIGAGAVVTRNVPENAVVGGNPARIIKYRGNIHENIAQIETDIQEEKI